MHTPESPVPASRELWGPRLSACVGLLLALLVAFVGDVGEFCLDDAWIHLSYAKSLRLGDGLSYNPGDHETGFSSPLWVLLLAAWPPVPDQVSGVKLLGALLHAGTAGLAAAIAMDLASARASTHRPLPVLSISLLAGCLVATAPTLLQGASSGMEVPLTTCLLLACLRASLHEQWLLAGVLAFAAELARPEVLACLLVFSTAAWIVRLIQRERPLLGTLWCFTPALAAGLALAVWVLYCEVVSGWPWPNTAYIKASVGAGDGRLAGGLAYLAAQVLPWQPWYVGVGGLALIAAAIWTELTGKGVLEVERPAPPDLPPEPPEGQRWPQRWQLVALLVAYLAGMLGTAISRPLDPAILFYQARYFAIFAPLPAIVIALGIARVHKLLALVLVLAIAAMTGLQIPAAHTLQRAQERGVSLLHGDPARTVARELPPDAVIAVEGAGSIRYQAPRTMEVVDIIGLNDQAIAHAVDDAAKACVLVQAQPQFFVLPSQIAQALSAVFEFRVRERFVDPAWAQVEEPYAVEVLLLEVVGVKPKWAQRCR